MNVKAIYREAPLLKKQRILSKNEMTCALSFSCESLTELDRAEKLSRSPFSKNLNCSDKVISSYNKNDLFGFHVPTYFPKIDSSEIS